MIIQQDDSETPYKIQRYENGKIWVNDKVYEGSIAIRGHKLINPWFKGLIADLTYEDFKIFEGELPNTIILGTGPTFIIPSMAMLRPFLEKGISVEYMDSKVACYTYTALTAENRDIAVFILL